MSNIEHDFNEYHAFPLTLEDSEYWIGENSEQYLPEQIIFATSSKRKALAMAYALHDLSFIRVDLSEFGLDFPERPVFANYQEMDAFFQRFVSNGDQSLDKKVLLGVYRGIPVYVDPQSGETSNNDHPKQEAALKAQSVAASYGDRKVLIFANDTVGLSSKLYPKRLGKPSNLLRQIEANFLGQFGEPLNYPLEQFEDWYIKILFAVGASLFHVAEVATAHTEVFLPEQTRDHLAEVRGWLRVDLDEEMVQHFKKIDWDSGMGGVWQLMLIINPKWLLDQISSYDVLPLLFPRGEEDGYPGDEHYLWYVYFWLIGVPVKPLFDAVKEDFVYIMIARRDPHFSA